MASVIESVCTWLKTCPSLSSLVAVPLDRLEADPVAYSVYTSPGAQTVQRYVGSGGMYRMTFILRRNAYMLDQAERTNANVFFETVADWIETKSLTGILPSLPSGKNALFVETDSVAYLVEENESGTGIYEMPCSLTYET